MRSDLEVKYLRSLIWHGDVVVDLLGGGTCYHPDGTVNEPDVHRMFAYPFDSVTGNDPYAVEYERYGTKGLLIRVDGNEQVRELNRSYYHARDYAYPITVFTLPDGRDALIHCPKEYCSLDIELAADGDCLTRRDYQSVDIFHTKLEVSEDGRFLVENAWVWQPWSIVRAYDIRKALQDPTHLDGGGIDVPQGGSLGWEPESATVCGHSVVTASVLLGNDDPLADEEFEIRPAEAGIPEAHSVDPTKVRKVTSSEISITDQAGTPIDLGSTNKRPADLHCLLQACDLDSGRITSSRFMPELVGRMMPAGPRHVVSFYDHPKLIEVQTGKVVARWEDLYAGPEQGQPSAMMRPPGLPALACDPTRRRFAIGSENHVTIVQLTGIDD